MPRLHGYVLLLLLQFSFWKLPVKAQELADLQVKSDSSLQAQPQLHKGRLALVTGTMASLYVGSMAYLQFVWYKDVPRVPFTFYNDLNGYKQIDKFGHVYGAYLESYIGFRSLVWAGVPRRKAAIYGGSLGFILQLPIEIWDGMYEGWGFYWSDVGANAMGSALVIGQELLLGEQPLTYKFSFSRSPYARQANGYLGNGFNELFNDYNGHTYWLSLGLNRMLRSEYIPDWLCLSVGYGAGGMFGEFRNRERYRGKSIPETVRYRQFFLSLDVDFTRIPCRRPFWRKVCQHLFLLKLPLPTLEYNTKNQWKLHGLYY